MPLFSFGKKKKFPIVIPVRNAFYRDKDFYSHFLPDGFLKFTPERSWSKWIIIAFLVLSLLLVSWSCWWSTRLFATIPQAESAAGSYHWNLAKLIASVPSGSARHASLVSRGAERQIRLGTARRIDRYLRGRKSPMTGLGYVFVREGELTGINPFLPVAISCIESGCGNACGDSKNPFGFLVAGEGTPLRAYPSWEAGIILEFRFIEKTWGKAQTSYDLDDYCSPDQPWQDNVAREVGKI